ncbi:dimethylarginine dimethylaminohydrolase family protein [Desulfobacula sp.]|uniref:dimethylarginine dimethylaminohydrolase family protein n=1 Tax=Desulfobacula sp. TaxID=2593537 RepID=UPI0026274B55|nr:arginine deiminase family protein [Desulfobacula sp.]
MFKNIIVRKPGRSMIDGISNAKLGKPDFKNALIQHENYIKIMEFCHVNADIIDADEHYPDSTFIEDTAVLSEKVAIITNPGIESRKGEEKEILKSIKKYYKNIEHIKAPGTCEGGDVMRVKDHFYIGLSDRTNPEGAEQLINLLQKYGYTGSTVEMNEMLHLKTGLSYLENNNLLVAGEFINNPDFKNFNRIIIPKEENYAANSIWVNDIVIVPAGFPKTERRVKDAGYKTVTVNISEFRKLDGGLSCLSLRF